MPEENHLQADQSFRDTARVLNMTRYLVGWEATGANGRVRACPEYAQERLQFGKPIGSFQLVQDLLAKMLANITASQCMVVRMAQLQAEGKMSDSRGTSQGIHDGKMPRDRRLGTGAIGWQRHRRGLQRGTLFRRRRSPLFLRRHVPDAKPDRGQGHHRLQRVCVTRRWRY